MNKDEKDQSFDSEDSDEDFCPENEIHDNLSEEETDDQESDNEIDTKKKTKLNKKTTEKVEEILENQNGKLDEPNEDEKKRSDSLWASFLSDVNSDSTSTSASSTSKPLVKKTEDVDKSEALTKTTSNKVQPPECKVSGISQAKKETIKVTEVLEFAGEKIEVTKELSVDDMKTKLLKNGNKSSDNNKLQNNKLPQILKRPSTGGLSSILGQIGKKNKLSVLEKTKMDWQSFKKDKGLEEEIKSHNRGKDGYLERQDFLERTDLKQFEIEKGYRQSKRSNR